MWRMLLLACYGREESVRGGYIVVGLGMGATSSVGYFSPSLHAHVRQSERFSNLEQH